MEKEKKQILAKTKVSKVKKVTENKLTISIYDIDGKEEKTVSLPKEIFGVKVNQKILAQYVRVYLINQRQGTASTKTRSEVTGSTRKIYRQKGTGKARHGDIKAPIFVGGGIAGGPKPKNYKAKINKKVKRLATTMALASKFQEKAIFGLADSFAKVEAKTKEMADFFKKINCNKVKILLVLPKMEKSNLILAVRNIPKLEITDALSLNPYQLLNNKKVFFQEESLKVLRERFLKKNES